MILFNFKDKHFYDETEKLQEQANLEQQLQAYKHNYDNLKEMYDYMLQEYSNLKFENHTLKFEKRLLQERLIDIKAKD